MPIKVVIVEDEMLVRLGMGMCLENYGTELKVVASFASAEEAEQYFENNTADVLITDIRLTGMNGLDLIRSVRVKCSNLVIMVVSCYEDFNYAREAMELGVDKYLVKHELSEDQLPKMLIDLYQKRHSNLSEMVKQPISKTPDEYKAVDFGTLQLGYVVLRGKSEKCNADIENINFEMFVEILQRILDIYSLGECFLRHSVEVFCIFKYNQEEDPEQIKLKLNDFFNNASINIKNYFNKNLYLIVSELFQDQNMINANFETVKEYSQYTFYSEDPQIIEVGLHKNKANTDNVLTLSYNNIFTEEWFSQTEHNIKQYFFARKLEFTPVEEVKLQVVRYINQMDAYLEKNFFITDLPNLFDKENSPDYININRFDSCEQLQEWLLMFVRTVKANLVNREVTIKKIEQFLEENYRGNLTLTQIADTFHMNSAYFCQYFKKKKGITFVHFLNQLRIDKAKQLLLNSDESVESIAVKVGIPNPNYFLRLFKKVTGMTVGQYRRSR